MADIKKINVNGTEYDIKDDSKLPLTGGTVTGDLIITAPHRDQYYASNLCRHFYKGTPTEFIIKTKIKYVSGTHMPVVRIYGYAYGLNSPIELRLGFYIYGGSLGWDGVVSTGAWQPEVYLFKYTDNSVDYVAVGLKGACYFCGFQVDCQIGASGSFGTNLSPDGWSTAHNGADTTKTLIPAVGTSNCVLVPYQTMKTSISGTATNVTGTVAIGNGGTGATTVAGAITNLGLDNKYVSKVTSTATYTRAYVVTNAAAQTVIDISSSTRADSLALRTSTGAIAVATTTANQHAARKDYVDVAMSTLSNTKLDKITGVTTFDVAYTKSADGETQWFEPISTGDDGLTLAMRTSTGALAVGTATDINHAVRKDYVDNGFVGKITSSATYSRAYIITSGGTNTVLNVTTSEIANSIVQRTSTGVVVTATPTAASHAATKKYVDDNIPTVTSQLGNDGSGNGEYIEWVNDTQAASIGNTTIGNNEETGSGYIYIGGAEGSARIYPNGVQFRDDGATTSTSLVGEGELVYSNDTTSTSTILYIPYTTGQDRYETITTNESLVSINNIPLIKNTARHPASISELITGETYHIYVPAGTDFDTNIGSKCWIGVSSYTNLTTTITPTSRQTGFGARFGYDDGVTIVNGFGISTTTIYPLNNQSGSFAVDFVYDGNHGSDITYIESRLLPFLTYAITNIDLPTKTYIQANVSDTSSTTLTKLKIGNSTYLIPQTTSYKPVYSTSYANYSFPIYSSTSTWGTSSHSLNNSNFANPGNYNFTIGTSSSSTYGCPYTPSGTRRAFIFTTGDVSYSSSYGGYRAIQDFYCPQDSKHYQRVVTKTSSTYSYGTWKDMTATGTVLYKHTYTDTSSNTYVFISDRPTAASYDSLYTGYYFGTYRIIACYYGDNMAGYQYFGIYGDPGLHSPSSTYVDAIKYIGAGSSVAWTRKAIPADLTDTVTQL